MATQQPKFFRVAVEGATVDGREIKREWLTQMAANYDRALYGARINVEHVKGFAPLSENSPFGSYGDVVALKAGEIDDGPLAGKMALYAQIDPTEGLVGLAKKRQKIYTSIEINPAFADTGEAYLVGLAATDDPASLGTEALQFAARRSGNLYSAAHETRFDFDIDEPASPGLLAIVKNLFARTRASDDQRYDDVRQAVEEIATFAAHRDTQQQRDAAELRAQLATAQQRADDAFAAVEQLREQLANTEAGTRRPPSTGGSPELATDC